MSRPSGPSGRPADPAPLPQQVGRYAIESELGRGGMGIVYRARDPILDRVVALKVLSPQLSGDEKSKARFLREARSMARIEHPNVVRVHDAGDDGGLPFFAMEYCEGESIERTLTGGALPVVEALTVIRDAAMGLGAAFAMGVVHRDVKPSNLIRDPTGRTKVLDFGLARDPSESALTATGVVMGTPDYMSPEQARGLVPDHRSDIYALGATLYQLLAGRAPFTGSNALAVLQEHIHTPPPPLEAVRTDVPMSVCRLIAAMMAKNVDQRPQTYAELVEAFGSQIASLPPPGSEGDTKSIVRFSLAAVRNPRPALSSPALYEQGVGSTLRFAARMGVMAAVAGLVVGVSSGKAFQAAVCCYCVAFLAPAFLALVDWVALKLIGFPTVLRRLFAAEAITSFYVPLLAFTAGHPKFGAFLALAVSFGARKTALERASGAPAGTALCVALLAGIFCNGIFVLPALWLVLSRPFRSKKV